MAPLPIRRFALTQVAHVRLLFACAFPGSDSKAAKFATYTIAALPECPNLRIADMKVREAIRLIELDGWYLVATRGSHRQYKHPTKLGRVTIPGKLSDELAPGTLSSILKQAGLKEQR